jgi:hypothetical protein
MAQLRSSSTLVTCASAASGSAAADQFLHNHHSPDPPPLVRSLTLPAASCCLLLLPAASAASLQLADAAAHRSMVPMLRSCFCHPIRPEPWFLRILHAIDTPTQRCQERRVRWCSCLCCLQDEIARGCSTFWRLEVGELQTVALKVISLASLISLVSLHAVYSSRCCVCIAPRHSRCSPHIRKRRPGNLQSHPSNFCSRCSRSLFLGRSQVVVIVHFIA